MMSAQVKFPIRRLYASWRTLPVVLVTAFLASYPLLLNRPFSAPSGITGSSKAPIDLQLDQTLQHAAVVALGERQGTIIVIDPQTGRVRAVVNPDLAFAKAVVPGSTLKPFTTLAAMRSGLINRNSRLLCREKYAHREFHTVCSHARKLAPLDPADAIAYSCNYYFARLGEHLQEPVLNETLAEFGFGQNTGINFEHEAEGKILRARWQPENAIGEGEYLQVTPIQLLSAYSAMVNGGRLLQPRIAGAEGFAARSRREIQIAREPRDVILAGMRGAVRFGTAEGSGLNTLQLYVYGKTGTSTPLKGFRSQGWFVGFASDDAVPPFVPSLGILVYLKRGHGADAAAVSRTIFEAYAVMRTKDTRTAGQAGAVMGRQSDRQTDGKGVAPDPVHIHIARENVTVTIRLENYVRSVVAAEGSVETELEALKALAVASRTYARKNRGRHRAEGYDFCTTTHCQRFASMSDDVREVVARATGETEGEVLLDDAGRLADSYFSASCGGQAANIETLWGSSQQRHLRGVVDPYCETMAHSHWIDVISVRDLLRASRTDARTDVGDRLEDVFISRTDKTGRAERITLLGQRRRVVSGWDFKIIVGRALGWSLLKSSRFEMFRSGSTYVFRGQGFGHGLGLCQEGAHVMANRGIGYRQILAKYFPDTEVGKVFGPSSRTSRRWYAIADRGGDRTLDPVAGVSTEERAVPRGACHPTPKKTVGFAADLMWAGRSFSLVVVQGSETVRRTMSSEHFRLDFPAATTQHDAEYLLHLLENNRSRLLSRVSLTDPAARLPFVEVFVNHTTGDFVGRTGLPWWAAAASREERIELQPLAVLKRRGILETTLRHELVHKLIDELAGGRTERWLAEGLAVYLAGEGRMLSQYASKTKVDLADLEQRLKTPEGFEQMRAAYAAAYFEVRRLITTEGEAGVWRRIAPGRH